MSHFDDVLRRTRREIVWDVLMAIALVLLLAFELSAIR